MELLFWISLFIVFYTFIGYGILLFLLVRIKRLVKKKPPTTVSYEDLPTLTIIVAAYNEEETILAKIENTLALTYPEEKLAIVVVTDGSTDSTPEIVGRYPQIKLIHSPERKGKSDAVHRAMQYVSTEIVVFTDANTIVNKEALLNIARHYTDGSIGAVSGEKRLMSTKVEDATAGEGIYWKYESLLKKWDAELYSVIGAAGELFSIRTALYEPVPLDSILDDFMISMAVVRKNFRIAYEPAAFAMEEPSADTGEELKRKIRIAAGGIQSIGRLPQLLNPFRNTVLCFQYLSHRVLRWTVTPFLLILSFVLNFFLVAEVYGKIYWLLLALQVLFYCLAVAGAAFQSRGLRIKLFFVPFYFCLMNYAVIAGIRRYFRGKQSASWAKAKRRTMAYQMPAEIQE